MGLCEQTKEGNHFDSGPGLIGVHQVPSPADQALLRYVTQLLQVKLWKNHLFIFFLFNLFIQFINFCYAYNLIFIDMQWNFTVFYKDHSKLYIKIEGSTKSDFQSTYSGYLLDFSWLVEQYSDSLNLEIWCNGNPCLDNLCLKFIVIRPNNLLCHKALFSNSLWPFVFFADLLLWRPVIRLII